MSLVHLAENYTHLTFLAAIHGQYVPRYVFGSSWHTGAQLVVITQFWTNGKAEHSKSCERIEPWLSKAGVQWKSQKVYLCWMDFCTKLPHEYQKTAPYSMYGGALAGSGIYYASTESNQAILHHFWRPQQRPVFLGWKQKIDSANLVIQAFCMRKWEKANIIREEKRWIFTFLVSYLGNNNIRKIWPTNSSTSSALTTAHATISGGMDTTHWMARTIQSHALPDTWNDAITAYEQNISTIIANK